MSISVILAWLSGTVGSGAVEKIVSLALEALARRRGTIECVAVATDSYALGVVEGAMLEEKPMLPISSSIFNDAVLQIGWRWPIHFLRAFRRDPERRSYYEVDCPKLDHRAKDACDVETEDVAYTEVPRLSPTTA